MTGRIRYLALACAAALFAVAILAQGGADRARAEALGGELLYLPNEKLLKHFTAGMNSIVADLLWLRCVQYVGTEVVGDRDFRWLQHMLDTVVRLDPYFTGAYRYGGMFLAALRADDDAGLDLINRGILRQPDSWQLPYEGAMIHLLNRRDEPGSKRIAAHYLAMSASAGQAPEFVRNLAVELQGAYDLTDIERRMWAEMLESDDRLLRQLAERNLILIELRESCRMLNERRAAYRASHGSDAPDLAALGLKQKDDPLGGSFFIDGAGEIQDTSVLDHAKEKALKHIRKALEAYQGDYDAWPDRLEDLVTEGAITHFPAHPYSDGSWEYDPETGRVR